ncbi:hypothetical protein ACI2KT_34785, partial [Ensifer adhaerens]|uniref:hypothetical protein n=1 Tax=Ensifer adhaerens TaxID=106592 RepID=UPI00384C09CC
CSSVKRLRFIPWSSQWARAYFKMDYFNGARSTRQALEVLGELRRAHNATDAGEFQTSRTRIEFEERLFDQLGSAPLFLAAHVAITSIRTGLRQS